MFHGTGTSGLQSSLWLATVELPHFAELADNVTADVCIIGGGIAGLSIAYQLLVDGLSVVLIEDGRIGSGETGRTTAHLSFVIDDRFVNLLKMYDEKEVTMIAASHMRAIDHIEQIVNKENIDCDFERLPGYLFLGDHDQLDCLIKEQEAAKKSGITDVEMIRKPVFQGIKLRSTLKFHHQAQFHPLKYLKGLANSIIEKGGKIFEKTHASKIKPGTTASVITDKRNIIQAKHVVIATNAPVYDTSFIFNKYTANRTYVITTRMAKNELEKGLFWDSMDPYHYVRTHRLNKDYDAVIIGGEDHRTGLEQKENKFEKLHRWALEHIPQLGNIEMMWSGQVLEPLDYLAFIGRLATEHNNIYLTSGDSGMGMTHGSIASILIPDLISNRDNPWETLYDPRRSFIKQSHLIISNSLHGSSGYLNYVMPGECQDINNIPPNHGAIVRKGLSKIAVYRDQQYKLHQHTAICPHMGGILCWNKTEHTWDCPVHGSRFTMYGEVVNGPANKNLEAVEKEKVTEKTE